jgi:hypothetical protein
VLTGNRFFPNLISGPFHHGLIIVFSAAIALSLGGAVISLLRGRQFYYDDDRVSAAKPPVDTADVLPDTPAEGAPTPPTAAARMSGPDR